MLHQTNSVRKIKTMLIFLFGVLFILAQLFYMKGKNGWDFNSFLLVIDILVFSALAFVEAKTLFFVLIFLLPLNTLLPKFEISIVTFGIYSGGLIILSFVSFFKIFFHKIEYTFNKIDILICLFNLTCLTFFFFSNDIIESGRVYYTTVVLPSLTYFLTKSFIKTQEDYDRFKKYFILSVFFVSSISLIKFMLSGLVRGSIAGFVGHIGVLMAIFFLINYRRYLYAIPIGFLIVTLIVGMSRILILLFFLSPVLIFFIKKGFFKPLVLSLCIISLAGTVLFSGVSSPQYMKSLREELRIEFSQKTLLEIDQSPGRLTSTTYFKYCLIGRTLMWRMEMGNFIRNPIFGNGIGNTAQKDVASSHNLHVQLLTYTGILGFVLFHLILISAFSYNLNSIDSVLKKDAVSIIIVSIIIYLNGITNGLFHGWFNMYLFMLIALIYSISKISYGKTDDKK